MLSVCEINRLRGEIARLAPRYGITKAELLESSEAGQEARLGLRMEFAEQETSFYTQADVSLQLEKELQKRVDIICSLLPQGLAEPLPIPLYQQNQAAELFFK